MAGQAITRITLDTLGSFRIRIPSLQEQHRVSNFLDATDSALRGVRSSLQLLRFHKAALMQQLFPSIEEFDNAAI